MIQFNGKWIYTLIVSGDLDLLIKTRLPISWEDPVSGIQYGDLSDLSTDNLNDLGWYKVLEDFPSITEYEDVVIDSRVFNNGTMEFADIYIAEYRPLEEVRALKLYNLYLAKSLNIDNTLDNKTNSEKFLIAYKSIALLIFSFSKADPKNFVNNNTYLQNVLTKINNLEIETDEYDARILLAETETDILTLINI